jgi:hypothetical protein
MARVVLLGHQPQDDTAAPTTPLLLLCSAAAQQINSDGPPYD